MSCVMQLSVLDGLGLHAEYQSCGHGWQSENGRHQHETWLAERSDGRLRHQQDMVGRRSPRLHRVGHHVLIPVVSELPVLCHLALDDPVAENRHGHSVTGDSL